MTITVDNEVKSFFCQIEKMNRANVACPVMSQSKILVVDDNVNNCEIMDSFFMVMGLHDRSSKIEFSLSGLQALKAIFYAHTNTQEPYRFGLIVIECKM